MKSFAPITRLQVIVTSVLIAVLVVGAITLGRARTYNASVDADMATLSSQVRSSPGTKPIFSLDQVSMDDSLRVRAIKRGYTFVNQPENKTFSLCAKYYPHPWVLAASARICRTYNLIRA
jgi:hypothetical protein